MKHVVQLVDSTQYVNTNCFQHQLLDGLRRSCRLTTVSLADVQSSGVPQADVIVSCLRLRTLDSSLAVLSRALRDRAVVVYEQDPWEAFKAGGACNGAYSRVVDSLNVSFFATTTHAWEARLRRLGFRARHVRMGMLPRYCVVDPPWHDRDVDVGFVGQVHPYREELFDALKDEGLNVQVLSGGDYTKYLSVLSRIKVFVHREASEYDVGGESVRYAEGLWAKDVEAIARGCVSVRNWHADAYEHMPRELIGDGLRMFEDRDVGQAVGLIRGALQEHAVDPVVFADDRKRCSDVVSADDAWRETARIIIDEHCDVLGVKEE